MRFANLMIVVLASGTLASGMIRNPTDVSAQAKAASPTTNEITAHSGILAWMDMEIARILTDIDASENVETQDALRMLRARANTLVFRVTQTLADDYPCRPTELQSASNQTDEPRATDYVEFDVAPELISMDSPVYPETALREGIEGTVLVRVLGAVGQAVIVSIGV